MTAATEELDTWMANFKQDAKAAGISPDTVEMTVKHIEFLPNLIRLDRAQPEFISPFLDYHARRVNAAKIARGQALLAEHAALLNQLEAHYGVPPSILVAFWGMETNYGTFQGNIDTFSALATLAYDGRRASFFRNQLLDAMRLADENMVDIKQLRGSWAGAFGHMQFMPTTLLSYAADGDQDQRIDIVNSIPDAFASAANYLAQVGWQKDMPAMLEVQLPGDFNWQQAQLLSRKPVKEWAKQGVRLMVELNPADIASSAADPGKIAASQTKPAKVNGKKSKKKTVKSTKSTVSKSVAAKPLSVKSSAETKPYADTDLPDIGGRAAILLPQGWRGPAFMVFDNFDVIMDWNRSVNYALSVAQLAKRLEGRPGILGGQLAETGGLSFQQMYELQLALNELGFDAGTADGFPGLQTQAAIRAYQVANRLPADGYASPSLYQAILEVSDVTGALGRNAASADAAPVKQTP